VQASVRVTAEMGGKDKELNPTPAGIYSIWSLRKHYYKRKYVRYGMDDIIKQYILIRKF